MKVDSGKLKADLSALVVKYQVAQLVVVYVDGRNVDVKSFACPEPAHMAGCKVIGEEISKLIDSQEMRAKVNAAMEAADV